MRSKYKLDTFVQATIVDDDIKENNISGQITGTIEGIITRKDGYQYILSTGHTVGEDQITQAFRPVVQRTSTTKKKTASKPSKKNGKDRYSDLADAPANPQ